MGKPKEKTKLTKARVDQERAPHKTGRQFIIWDSELKGFGLLISGKTNTKSYIAQKDVNGKTRRVTIQQTNVIDLPEARKRATKLLLQLGDGYDPKTKDKVEKLTLREALEEYLKNQKSLRERTVKDYRDVLKILSDWADRPIMGITSEKVRSRHRKIKDDVQKRARTSVAKGHTVANRTMRILRAIWNHAKDLYPDLPDNPVKLSKGEWYPEPRRDKIIKASDLPSFYEATISLPNPVQRDCILLMLFSGLRSAEARGLTWEEVDFEEKVIRLPSIRVKSGRKLDLPMSNYIYTMLKKRRELGGGDWVFPADSKSGHIEEPKYPLRLIKDKIGIHISPHDLRRTFITIAESCNIAVYALKGLVNHSMGMDVTAGYINADAERLREPMQKVTDRLKDLVGITEKGKVVPIRRAEGE